MPVQTLNRSIRDELYRRTLEDMPTDPVSQCLEFAWQGYQAIKEYPGAPRTIIQAGSAQWPRVEDDDGVSPTHFAYMWEPDSEVAQRIRRGIVTVVRRADGLLAATLPEMHVWLGCPETGEIIDFSTGTWPEACRATIGLGWPAERPPEYLWTFGSRLPADVRYVADIGAIQCALFILRQQGREYP